MLGVVDQALTQTRRLGEDLLAATPASFEEREAAREVSLAAAAPLCVLRRRMKSIHKDHCPAVCVLCGNRATDSIAPLFPHLHTFEAAGSSPRSIDRDRSTSGMANNSRGAPAADTAAPAAACSTTQTRRPPSSMGRRTGRRVGLLGLLGLLVLSLVLLVPAVGASPSSSTGGDIKARGVKGAGKVRARATSETGCL